MCTLNSDNNTNNSMVDEVMQLGSDFDSQMRLVTNDEEHRKVVEFQSSRLNEIAAKYGYSSDDEMLEDLELLIQ